MDMADYGIEHVHNGIYHYWLGNEHKYTGWVDVPDWARVIYNEDRQSRRDENRQRKLKRDVLNKTGGGLRGGYEKPNARLSHPERVCSELLNRIQPGYECAQGVASQQGKCYVNCYDESDWLRHEKQALR